jgi:hypothetical protein
MKYILYAPASTQLPPLAKFSNVDLCVELKLTSIDQAWTSTIVEVTDWAVG